MQEKCDQPEIELCLQREGLVDFLHLAYATLTLVRAEVFNSKCDNIRNKLTLLVVDCLRDMRDKKHYRACDELNFWRERIKELLRAKRPKNFKGKVSIPPLVLGSLELIPALEVKTEPVVQSDCLRWEAPYFFVEEARADFLGCPSYVNGNNLCAIS